jgi:hypothetical protein
MCRPQAQLLVETGDEGGNRTTGGEGRNRYVTDKEIGVARTTVVKLDGHQPTGVDGALASGR